MSYFSHTSHQYNIAVHLTLHFRGNTALYRQCRQVLERLADFSVGKITPADYRKIGDSAGDKRERGVLAVNSTDYGV